MIRRRRATPSASDTTEDTSYPGARVPPARLPPSLVGLVAGTGLQRIKIPIGTAAVVIPNVAIGATVAVTITVAGGTTFVVNMGSNGRAYLRASDGFVSATWSSSVPTTAFLVVDTGRNASTIDNGQTVAPPSSSAGLVEFENTGSTPTSLAGLSALAVLTAGVSSIQVGILIYFDFTIGLPTLTTPADQNVWLGLRAHTSGAVLAALLINGSTSGSFRMPLASGDTIDIVAQNADTTAHTVFASWSAWSGV